MLKVSSTATKTEDRIYAFLFANRNLAYSGLELLARFVGGEYYGFGIFIPDSIRLWWSLGKLERRGLIESKMIGSKRYYRAKQTQEMSEEADDESNAKQDLPGKTAR